MRVDITRYYMDENKTDKKEWRQTGRRIKNGMDKKIGRRLKGMKTVLSAAMSHNMNGWMDPNVNRSMIIH